MAAPWPGLHGIKTVLGLPVGVIAPGVCGLVDEGWLEKRMAPRGEPRHQKSDATPVPTSRAALVGNGKLENVSSISLFRVLEHRDC